MNSRPDPRRSAVAILTVVLAILPIRLSTAHAGPPMGWNSWNHFSDKVTETDIRKAADALVTSGMAAAGYRYVIIDDGWQGTRDASGVLHSNPRSFPDMKALADYVHARGLKFGIYSSPGPKTCAGFTGSSGHETEDARQFAAWGVDYLKYDLCSLRGALNGRPLAIQKEASIVAFQRMHEALDATGRPIVYALSTYGWNRVWEWGASVGASTWRTTTDIGPSYTSMIFNALGTQAIPPLDDTDHWNDPDMLEIGNDGFDASGEARTHMTLWAMLAAPLIAGNDLSALRPETREILTNRDLIKVDQDPGSRAGRMIRWDGAIQTWRRDLSDGSTVMALVNTLDHEIDDRANDVLAPDVLQRKARDLWTHRDVAPFSGQESLTIGMRDVLVLRFAPK